MTDEVISTMLNFDKDYRVKPIPYLQLLGLDSVNPLLLRILKPNYEKISWNELSFFKTKISQFLIPTFLRAHAYGGKELIDYKDA